MITIPTSELIGVLADAIPFAATNPDQGVIHCVRVEWDSKQLHAMATDRYRIGWATWDPDDQPTDNREEDLFTKWGGAVGPWQINLPLDDVKDIVKIFKLPAKEHGTPLTVEHLFSGHLRIMRSKDTGHSAISHVTRGIDEAYPDLRAMFDTADLQISVPVEQIMFDGSKLAAFGKVRQTGPVQLQFTGEHGMARVKIGERFVGAIQPARDWERTAPRPGDEDDEPDEPQPAQEPLDYGD